MAFSLSARRLAKTGLLLTLTAASLGGPLAIKSIPQVAEETITEDELATAGGTSWAGSGLPFSELTNIEETLVGEVVGRIVIDRHGVDGDSGGGGFFGRLNSFISNPFASPSPGKMVFISMWGSKYEGCFAELIFQTAPSSQINDAAAIAPVQMEVGVDGRIVSLSADASSVRTFSQDYTYTVYEDGRNNEYQGRWYMGRQVFFMDANTALALSNATPQVVRARVTFANSTTEIYEIGEETVQLWKGAFSFNPSCRNASAAPPQQPSQSGSSFSAAPVAPNPPSSPTAPTTPALPVAPATSEVILQARGVLDNSAPIIQSDGSRYREHTFRGSAGQTVTITMSSAEFDTYLILLGPDGETLAQNDDIDENNLNSRITIQLPTTGVYRVWANSYDDTGRGSYQLVIR